MSRVMREVELIVAQLRAQHWRVTSTRRTKLMAWPPNGTDRPVPIHLTPSDARWRKNLVARLKNAGAEIE